MSHRTRTLSRHCLWLMHPFLPSTSILNLHHIVARGSSYSAICKWTFVYLNIYIILLHLTFSNKINPIDKITRRTCISWHPYRSIVSRISWHAWISILSWMSRRTMWTGVASWSYKYVIMVIFGLNRTNR